MKTLTLSLVTLMLISACRGGKQNPDKNEIMKLTHEVNAASLRGHINKNAEEITSAYTNDAVILPPGGVGSVIGLDNIKNYYVRQVQGPGKSIDIKTQNTRFDVIDQDNAVELGEYSILYQASDTSKQVTISGEMLIVWKRVDGQWKIYLDMWH